MKRLIIFLGLELFGLQCTKTETITALALPCDCKDLPMIYEYKGLEGIIRFPRKPSEPYGILIPKLSNGEASNYFGICTDSVSMSLIKTNKITDSTVVSFNGGGINTAGTNNEIACAHLGAFRITNLVKIR